MVFKYQGKIKEEGEDAKGFVVFYAEINLLSNKAKVFIDFTDSFRNTFTDADLVASNFTDEPLKQIRVFNDGTADFVRIGINGGPSVAPYIKVKFGENVTLPFVDTKGRLVLDMVLKADTSNATVRILGLA